MPLTDIVCKNAKCGQKPKKLADGVGCISYSPPLAVPKAGYSQVWLRPKNQFPTIRFCKALSVWDTMAK